MRHCHRLPFSAMYVVHSVLYVRSIRDQDNLGMGVHIIWDPRLPRLGLLCGEQFVAGMEVAAKAQDAKIKGLEVAAMAQYM